MAHNLFNTLQDFKPAAGKTGKFYSLPALEKAGIGKISRLPVSIRIVLESVLRNCDGKKVTEEHVRAARQLEAERRRAPTRFRSSSRASCCRTSPACRCSPTWPRCAASPQRHGQEPEDRSSRWCRSTWWSTTRCRSTTTARTNALDLNMKLEFQRNRERYQFMKWGMQAFDTFRSCRPASASCTR